MSWFTRGKCKDTEVEYDEDGCPVTGNVGLITLLITLKATGDKQNKPFNVVYLRSNQARWLKKHYRVGEGGRIFGMQVRIGELLYAAYEEPRGVDTQAALKALDTIKEYVLKESSVHARFK